MPSHPSSGLLSARTNWQSVSRIVPRLRPFGRAGRQLFLVQSLPVGNAAEQLQRVLSRLKAMRFRESWNGSKQRHQIDVALTWTEGISLAEYLQNIRDGRRPPVEPAQALRLVNGLAHAVCHLQRRLQVNHGDIQPANVIITSPPAVCSSSISAVHGQPTGPLAAPKATAITAATPRRNFRPVTPVTLAGDQFSVSVLLFELLTQQLPYGGLGGKAGRPEFIRTRRRYPGNAQSDFVQLQAVTPVTPRPTRCPCAAWSGPEPERSLSRSQHMAESLERAFRLVSHCSELTPIENMLTRVIGLRIGWFVNAFSPDGNRLASGSIDKKVKIWETTSGNELLTLKGHSCIVLSLAFSPDGKRLAMASVDEKVKIWDATSGTEIFTLSGHAGTVNSVAFSPDGNQLASASDDETVRVWDATNGDQLLSLKGLTDMALCVAFSPDGKWVASATGNNFRPTTPVEVKVWDAANGNELLTLKGHGAYINSVAFSPDGKMLASASLDKTVKVWDLRDG
jgi:hypothetical protein